MKNIITKTIGIFIIFLIAIITLYKTNKNENNTLKSKSCRSST